MDWIREKLSSIGVFCILAGIISSVLQLIGYELSIFRALNDAGPAVAWGVRIGFVAVGAVFYLLGPKSQPEKEAAPQNES